MHVKRTATFAAGGAALAAWLAAAATSSTRVEPPTPARAVRVDSQMAELATQVARLHDRLVPAAQPLEPARDLFRFAGVRSKPGPAQRTRAALAENPAAPAVPPRPPLKLAGIAEDAQGGTVVRTAIISTATQLFLVKEGESVTSRFKVLRIGAEVVELTDLLDNSTIRLPLP